MNKCSVFMFVSSTKSEALFTSFCRSLGYTLYPIPVQETQTPDFMVRAPAGDFFAEVKQLDPNPQDLVLLAQAKRGEAVFVSLNLGGRARGLIEKAADQLRSVKQEGLPGLIILYDNIRLDGGINLGPGPLTSDHISAALFGDWVVDVKIDNCSGRIIESIDRHGPHETVTLDRKTYVSAVIVLCDDCGPLTAQVYHNPFAAVALPEQFFEGHSCHHFKVPREEAKRPQSWGKVA